MDYKQEKINGIKLETQEINSDTCQLCGNSKDTTHSLCEDCYKEHHKHCFGCGINELIYSDEKNIAICEHCGITFTNKEILENIFESHFEHKNIYVTDYLIIFGGLLDVTTFSFKINSLLNWKWIYNKNAKLSKYEIYFYTEKNKLIKLEHKPFANGNNTELCL